MEKMFAKRIVSLLICLLMVLPFVGNIGFAQEATQINIDEVAEAESGAIAGRCALYADATASGGNSVQFNRVVMGSSGHIQPASTEPAELSFTVNVATAGTYNLYIECSAESGGNDSVWYRFAASEYTQFSPGTTSGYVWKKLGSFALAAGANNLDFVGREAGFRIDRVIVVSKDSNCPGYYDGLKVNYAAPKQTSGDVIYPKTLDADSIGNVAKFEAGDRVAFIGDSITHGGYFHSQIFNYYATRYPNVSFSYVNKGINGNTASSANARINHDIYDALDTPFNKAVIMLGTNDMSRGEYYAGNELLDGADARREQLINNYTTNIMTLINSVKAKGTQKIILVSPPIFDEWLGESNKPTSPDFNNVIRKAGSILYDIAKTDSSIDFVDINTPQLIIEKYNLNKSGNTFTFVSDRVHPSNVGHYIMTYAFLKAQGESGEVASTNVDVAANTINASNADVSNLAVNNDTVSYSYTAKSLPIGADATYRNAEDLFPITEELNREIIRVSGLVNGVYNVKIDNAIVMRATNSQLENGINIADKQNNPGQQQALKVTGLANQRWTLEKEYRDFIANEVTYISKYSLDSTSAQTFISSAQNWINANSADSSKTEDIKTLNAYITAKQEEQTTLADIAKFETEAYKMNKPTAHNVVIEHSSDAADSQANSVYINYELDQNTVSIKDRSIANGISLDRVVFSNASGELAAMPEPQSTITASAVIANNTDAEKSAVMWVATYNNNNLVDVVYENVSLASGQSVPVAAQVRTKNGADSIRAGVWDSLVNVRPYMASAVFPSNETGIKNIYVNRNILSDFDESETQYTYYVPRLETKVPFVSTNAKNINADISVTQASAIGTAASVNTGAKTYTVNFEYDPVPVLSSLSVGDTAVSGFAPTTYEYECDVIEGESFAISAQAATGLTVEVTQAPNISSAGSVKVTSPLGKSRTYTVNMNKAAAPGTLSNVKWKGVATASVYGVPSVGIDPPDIYNAYTTDAERIAATKALANTKYDVNTFSAFNERGMEGGWETAVSNIYGYNMKFMYADTANQDSILYGKNVTRLYKHSKDSPTAATAASIYEFDISKDATVYISTSASKAQSRTATKSTYIEGLNKGWTYDYNTTKYGLWTWKIGKTIVDSGDSKSTYVPNGTVNCAWASSGSVYYKHFKVGEKVEVPAFSETASNMQTSIFIVWDECNDEAKLFDIMADGTSITGFNANTTSYNVMVADDSPVPQISVSATFGANAIVTQAATLNDTATVTACGKTYTISFSTRDTQPGTLSNVKWKGALNSSVYGIPSLAMPTLDLYNTYDTDAERKAAVKAQAGTIYDTNDYSEFSNLSNGNSRCLQGQWGTPITVSGTPQYAYALKFTYAQTDSMFIGSKVTRLYKPDRDMADKAAEQAYASRIYEFDIDKDATVYITTAVSQSGNEARSTYIEGLNKGWTYEYNTSKYKLYQPQYKNIYDPDGATSTTATAIYYVPNGGLTTSWNASGSVYYKHFKAGDHIEIPAFAETESYLKLGVFVIWDNCNSESKVFDIRADGTSITGFNVNTTSYNVTVEEGSPVPQISVSATYGANATVTQAETLNDTAKVTTADKTYTINFVQTAPALTLSALNVDGELISGFDAATNEYTYTVERGVMTIPKITATPTITSRTVSVKQAVKMPGKATVTVSTASGASADYTVNIVKTGTPGVVSNIYAGGVATEAVTAVPSLGAEIVDMYNVYSTDEERIAAVKSSSNPYTYDDARYAQYTNRSSGSAWTIKSSDNTYGSQKEFTYINHPKSILISPDVTRLYKSTNDPSGSADIAKKSYEFDISKDATVYITTTGVSSFIAEQGWTYESNEKYRVYSPATTTVADIENASDKYAIPNGAVSALGNANGIVYKKHFTKEERVAVPAFAADASYRKMNVFIVWDDCNDENNIYGMKYVLNGVANNIDGFNANTKEYNVTLPAGTTSMPELRLVATRPANAQVNMPQSFENGRAIATVSAKNADGINVTYTVNFYVDSEADDDVRVSSVSFDGNEFADFDMYVRNYDIDLPFGATYPTVSVVANSASTPSPIIVQPSQDNDGVCTINVTSQNGNYNATYTINFTILEYVPAVASIMPIKNNMKGIVTIVHDDGTMATVDFMNDEFAKNNLKGTIAMIAKNVNSQNVSAWQSYLDTGRFNMATHSYTHKYWGQSDEAESGTLSDGTPYSITDGNMTKEIITSGEYLRQMFPNERVLSFVKPGFTYPTGLPQVSDAAYEMIRNNYICMRNTGGGMNTIPPADWDNVRSLMVRVDEDLTSVNNHTAAYWTDEVDKTIANNGWLVFLFHAVVDDASANGLSVAKSQASMFYDALGDRVENGDVWCAFLDEAAMYIKESQTASVVAKDYTTTQNKITVAITDQMDDSIYNYPVTAKVAVPDTWTYVKMTQGDRIEVVSSFTEGATTYVYANVVPDSVEATLAQASSTDYVESITVNGVALDGFSPTDYDYEITLPAGTTEAPIVAAQYAGGTYTSNQATLTDGSGTASIAISVGVQTFTYNIRFKVNPEGNGPVVLLKFDDLREGSAVRRAMANAVDYLIQKGVKVNVGVIGVSLEDDGTKAAYYNQIRTWAESGKVEIWNHGYYHGGDIAEFKGGTYEAQLQQLTDTNALLYDKCGVTVKTFGAPGNQTDATTPSVLEAVPQIKTTFFGPGNANGVLDLTNRTAFEQSGTIDGTWKTWLNYKTFVASYNENKALPYVVMQTHPGGWATDTNSTQFKIFRDQIDYLISQGAVFMTATEYNESIAD